GYSTPTQRVPGPIFANPGGSANRCARTSEGCTVPRNRVGADGAGERHSLVVPRQAPDPSSATWRRSFSGRRIHAATDRPSRTSATIIAYSGTALEKLRVPSTGSTNQTRG